MAPDLVDGMLARMHDPTREAALLLLASVLDTRRPLEEALDALGPMDPRDRAASHRLVATVLRRTGTLDALLEPLLRKRPPSVVWRILQMGAAGLVLLGTPSHAAVATAVALTRARGFAQFSGLVNAVLRRVADVGPAALREFDAPRLDTPLWLWASWGSKARAIALAHQTPAPLDITLRPGAIAPSGVALAPTRSVRFPAGTRIFDIPGFVEGAFWAQDFAAALPARLLAVRQHERVLDLCAAPGGKTAQLAADGARVVAIERDASRLQRLQDNLRRLRLTADIVHADATEWKPPGRFDAVLLDAPCSATGTIRRHPDVLYLKRSRDVSAMTGTQDRLIAAAAQMVERGGRLIYTVCSLQREEGATRIESALASRLWQHDPFTAEELAFLPEGRTPQGFLRTHPGLWPLAGGMDGFFAARLVRA